MSYSFMHHPRLTITVGARIEQDHSSADSDMVTIRARRSRWKAFSHWPSLGSMPNHLSACSSVVSYPGHDCFPQVIITIRGERQE